MSDTASQVWTNVDHLPIFKMELQEAVDTLLASVYPGAKRESAAMALLYCKAQGLDPLQKPVHIVQISVKSGRTNGNGDDIYENRDVILPGIDLYRIRAARTERWAGISEPEYGRLRSFDYKKRVTRWENKVKKETWEDAKIEFPEWCKITVYRIVGGERAAFPAIERWSENYASAGRYTDAPNSMWARRPFAQLAKCAEAQALRRGFPEACDGPTAEEMEGKAFVHEDDAPPAAGNVYEMPQPKAEPVQPEAAPAEAPADAEVAAPSEVKKDPPKQQERRVADKPAGTRAISVGERKFLERKIAGAGLDADAVLKERGIADWDSMTEADFQVIKKALGA